MCVLFPQMTLWSRELGILLTLLGFFVPWLLWAPKTGSTVRRATLKAIFLTIFVTVLVHQLWGFPVPRLQVDHGFGRSLMIGVGVLLYLVGIGLYLWATRTLGRLSTSAGEPAPASTVLKVGGPYRWTRNPIYLAGFIHVTGYELLANSWFILIIFPMIVLFQIYVLDEEFFLRDQFGANYEEYCRRTPRWIGHMRQN